MYSNSDVRIWDTERWVGASDSIIFLHCLCQQPTQRSVSPILTSEFDLLILNVIIKPFERCNFLPCFETIYFLRYFIRRSVPDQHLTPLYAFFPTYISLAFSWAYQNFQILLLLLWFEFQLILMWETCYVVIT